MVKRVLVIHRPVQRFVFSVFDFPVASCKTHSDKQIEMLLKCLKSDWQNRGAGGLLGWDLFFFAF